MKQALQTVLFVGALTLPTAMSPEEGVLGHVENSLNAPAPLRGRGADLITGSATAMAIDPSDGKMVYVAIENRGLFKSTDAGMTWKKMKSAGVYAKGKVVQTIVVHPKDSSIVFAGTRKGGLFKSTDGGLNWRAVNTGAPGFLKAYGIQQIAINSKTPMKIYVGCIAALYKSIDGGETWAQMTNTIEAGGGLAINPKNPKIMFTAGCLVQRSTDEGKTWKWMRKGLPTTGCMSSLHIDPLNPNRVYVVTLYNGFYKSTDNGETWKKLWLDNYTGQFVISPSNPDIIYASTDLEIYRSLCAGYCWERICDRMPSSALAVDPVDPAIVFSGYLCLIKSTNSGVTWAPANAGLPVYPYCSDWEYCEYEPPCPNCGSGNVYWDTSVNRCRDRENGQFVDDCCCGRTRTGAGV